MYDVTHDGVGDRMIAEPDTIHVAFANDVVADRIIGRRSFLGSLDQNADVLKWVIGREEVKKHVSGNGVGGAPLSVAGIRKSRSTVSG